MHQCLLAVHWYDIARASGDLSKFVVLRLRAFVHRAKPVPSNTTFVDRHPLFYKPREYYESTSSNKAAKTAAAAVMGVPAGIYGELKQIVVGAPASSPSGY